jgi:hypothetical protein
MPDMPRFLWWSGALPDNPVAQKIFGHLAEQCDRLMIDTGQMKEPSIDLVALSHLTLQEEQGAALGDLNWHRFARWRHLLAQTFDLPELRAQWRAIRRGTVEWAGQDSAVPVEVLLYLGWLASSLGWTVADVRPDGFDFVDRREQPVSFALLRRELSARGLVSIELATERAVIRLQPIDQSLESLVDGHSRLAVPRPHLELASVLESELGILTRNPSYEAALRVAERLAAASR